jgi:CelD/BcsL family acetyltransferase involved in cellulose biosynthesis/aminoglycoside phosphotransferase (APT) family kinase protein
MARGPTGVSGVRRWRGQLLLSCIRWAVDIRDCLHGPLLRRRERRIGEELRGLLPDLLTSIPNCPGHLNPTSWTSVHVERTLTDSTVAFLSSGQGSPAAVLRVARTPVSARELRANHEALAVLSADPRLTELYHLLPQTLAFWEDAPVPLAMERYLPGTDLGTLLARTPDRLEAALAAALAAIAVLHRHTGHIAVVSQAHLEQWVDSPLEDLRRMCQALGPAYLATVDRLGMLLRQALAGQRVSVSWTHGDFTPGNVLLEGGQASGIVDWGGARPDRPSVLDAYLMLITARCLVERRPLGSVVVRLLESGRLGRQERNLLEQFWVPRSGQVGCTPVPEPVLILLTWLHHLAELCRKCGGYCKSRAWWMLNAEPVLQAIPAVLPGQQVASASPHGGRQPIPTRSLQGAPVKGHPARSVDLARGSMEIDVVHPDALTETELARWRGFQQINPSLASPFLSPEFTVAVGRLRPRARVAILSTEQQIVGFLPFEQHRAGYGTPLAAGLTDCQGLVHAPGTRWDAQHLVRACKLEVLEFDRLVEGQGSFEPHLTGHAPCPIIDLSAGFEAYLAQVRRNSSRFAREMAYKRRRLTRDVGEVEFVYHSVDDQALHALIGWKSAQYRRTGRPDCFARSWIRALVDDLFSTQTEDFSSVLSMLYAGGRPVAGHLGLYANSELAGWFPAFDPRFAKYSPGLLHHMHLAQAGADAGVARINMGRGSTTAVYKQLLANCELTLAKGRVSTSSPVAGWHCARKVPVRWLRHVVRESPRLRQAADRAFRRYGAIRTAVYGWHRDEVV